MTEPTYIYFRGKGWQPTLNPYPTLTQVIGNYYVTLTLRTPDVGEYFFTSSSKELILERVMDAINQYYWLDVFNDRRGELAPHFPRWGDPKYEHIKFQGVERGIVVTWTRTS